jgi:hypothetical protein
MDAVRICDNLPVMLKRSRYSTNGFEIDCTIGTRRAVAGAEPRNHATHIYDILDVPNDEDATILVLPLLRQWDEPGFETIGEAVDFFGQIFEVRTNIVALFFPSSFSTSGNARASL